MSAVVLSSSKAIELVLFNGAAVMVGGFGLVGAPLTLIGELNNHSAGDFTIISNNLGEPGKALGQTLKLGKVKHAIGSYFTSNPDVGLSVLEGSLEVTLLPQGTFIEAIRAGGAGIGGFFTPTGAGTQLTAHKESRTINGRLHVLEEPIRADIALIRAYKADQLGNLTYWKTARNFNPIMATAATRVVAEVDEIVLPGELDPEAIVTPHIYVDYVVKAEVVL